MVAERLVASGSIIFNFTGLGRSRDESVVHQLIPLLTRTVPTMEGMGRFMAAAQKDSRPFLLARLTIRGHHFSPPSW